jgi:uncharacterized membrane protein YqhA
MPRAGGRISILYTSFVAEFSRQIPKVLSAMINCNDKRSLKKKLISMIVSPSKNFNFHDS